MLHPPCRLPPERNRAGSESKFVPVYVFARERNQPQQWPALAVNIVFLTCPNPQRPPTVDFRFGPLVAPLLRGLYYRRLLLAALLIGSRTYCGPCLRTGSASAIILHQFQHPALAVPSLPVKSILTSCGVFRVCLVPGVSDF